MKTRGRAVKRSPIDHTQTEVPGKELTKCAGIFRVELQRNPILSHVKNRYVHAFFNKVAQSVACAHLLRVDQRYCRWLLMTRDQMPSDHFMFTHECLSMML